MVKSKLIKNNNLDFPKLMIDDEGTVVLMISKTAGTVVGNRGEYHSEIGFYSGLWSEDYMEDYYGTIELSNEVSNK